MGDTMQSAGLVDDHCHQLDGDPGQSPMMRINGGDGDGQPIARAEERGHGISGVLVYPQQHQGARPIAVGTESCTGSTEFTLNSPSACGV